MTEYNIKIWRQTPWVHIELISKASGRRFIKTIRKRDAKKILKCLEKVIK